MENILSEAVKVPMRNAFFLAGWTGVDPAQLS